MITTPKIFNQVKATNPAVTYQLYEVPAGRSAQVTLFVCNQNSAVENVRIALVKSTDTLESARYIAWDTPLVGNGVFSVSGIGLDSLDRIFVKSNLGNLSFTATGIELA